MLTRYAPLRRSPSGGIATPDAAPRLACVKPAASVHPEPGSNSSLYISFLLGINALVNCSRYFVVLSLFLSALSMIFSVPPPEASPVRPRSPVSERDCKDTHFLVTSKFFRTFFHTFFSRRSRVGGLRARPAPCCTARCTDRGDRKIFSGFL